MPGVYVSLEDTITAFEKIVNWEMDDVSEENFLYKSTIEEVMKSENKE